MACVNGRHDYKWWLDKHKFNIQDEDLWCQLLNEVATGINGVNGVRKLIVHDNILNKALIPLSDIEGEPDTFLIKLKQANVIKGVKINPDTHKLEIVLNKDFCGTIAFCGDLTSYKLNSDGSLHVHRYGNEMIIELFEELLAQIKEHNKNKEKDKQIQFVAVPGNHEFVGFQGGKDDNAVMNVMFHNAGDIDSGSALLVKLRGLKVLADIQKYFLEQVQQNNQQSDIEDEDYDNIDIGTKIADLQSESENLSASIGAIIDAKKDGKILPDHVWTELITDPKFETLPEFDWENSKLLPKIVFSHHGRKFRILHSFALFTPEEYLSIDDNENSPTYGKNIATNNISSEDQQRIFSDAFRAPTYNINGVGIKDFPDKTVFAKNKIPTFVGHEGTKRDTNNGYQRKQQSPQVFCIDESSFAPGGYTYIVTDDNVIQGYVTKTGQNDEEQKKQDCTAGQHREVGNAIAEEQQGMVTRWTQDGPFNNISSYIDNNGNSSATADAIMALKNRSAEEPNVENYLKKCQRWLAFSDKDRRAQQVYETYKMLAEPQNELNANNQRTTMIELNGIHSINTPCGGCL